jgi:hypothetical protein
MKEIDNAKEQTKNTKKKTELWLSYGRVSSMQQITD